MTEEAIFFNVGNNCGVAHALLGAWILQDRGTILRFREIHDELVPAEPTVQGVGAALGLAVSGFNIPTDAVTVSRVKTFGTVLHAMLPEALKRLSTASLVGVPGIGADSTTVVNPDATGDTAEEVRAQAVSVRQWEAHRMVHNLEKPVKRSRQVADRHVFRWNQDAINFGRLSHFPPLLKVVDAAHAKQEQNRSLGEGLRLTFDFEEDNVDERALVARCIEQAGMYLDGLEAALTIIIPGEADGGPPGTDGYMVFQADDGTRKRRRYFAVLFFKVIYERYLRASKEEPYWALPAIFLHALIKCGDEIGAFDCHADRAVAKVIDADVWTAAASGAKDPRAGKSTDGGKGGPGGKGAKLGRCRNWDKDGKCARGKSCPWQGSHGSKPKRDYTPTTDTDDKDDGKDGKFQWSKRRN